MNLILNNVSYEKHEDDILQDFANSEIFNEKTLDEKVRLALFISYQKPNGLNSRIDTQQFNDLWDYWCGCKYKFIKILSVAEVTQL